MCPSERQHDGQRKDEPNQRDEPAMLEARTMGLAVQWPLVAWSGHPAVDSAKSMFSCVSCRIEGNIDGFNGEANYTTAGRLR